MSFEEFCKRYSGMSESQVRQSIKLTNMETWPIAKIEKLVQANNNVHSYARELPQEVIRKRINTELVELSVNGKVYPAADIFFGYDLIDRYRLADGDDTTHILEFVDSSKVVTIKDSDQVEIKLKKEFVSIEPKFYQVDPEKLIDEGYLNAKELFCKDQGLQIVKSGAGQEQLIFTILKGPGEIFYKKLVWVIKRI